MMGDTSEAGTGYFSEVPEFTTDILWGSCCSIDSFLCCVLWTTVYLFCFFIRPLYYKYLDL